jgi:HK97 family phage portal protein
MANPLSQFFQDRFIQPAVDAGVEKALTGTYPVAVGVGTVPEVSLEKAIGQPHDANYALLYALYKLNTDVSGCVHKWAGGVTGAGWRITTMDPDATITPMLEKQMQEIERWLKNPNPQKLFESMLYELVQHFGVVGDGYWYVTEDTQGQPLEIWPMHPALTKIVATKQGEVLGYVMRTPGGEPVAFTADEVLHFPLPNPTNDLYGESPLELVLEEAGIDLQALRSNKAIFQNGMSPSAVLLMDETAKAEDAKVMTDMLKQSHTGASNQHKVMALSKTRDFKPWTMTNRDLEYLKLRDLATSKVTTAYRLPKVLLGHHNAGDYATTKFLIRDTYAHVYRPMQRLIESIITERLIHRFSPELRFELIKPDASDPDDIRKDQMAAKDKGILTADEVRSDAFGKDPLEEETEAPAKDEQKPDTDAGDTAEDAPATAKAITKALSKDDATVLADSREREMEALAQAIEPSLVAFFTAQEQRFQSLLTEDVLKSSVAKDVDDYAALLDESENTFLHALLFGLLVSSLESGLTAAQLQIGITLSLEQANPIVQQYLQTDALQHVKGINQTTRERLRTELNEGIGNGEGMPQLKQRVSQVFTEAKGYRAQMIARTETAQAYSYANEQALEATGVVSEYQWLTAQDERVCPICGPLHGERRKTGQQYSSGLKPAFAHIQCRCSEIGVVEEAS